MLLLSSSFFFAPLSPGQESADGTCTQLRVDLPGRGAAPATCMDQRTPKLKKFPSHLNLVLFGDLFLKGRLKCRNRRARCVRFETIVNAWFSTTTLRTQGLAWRSKKKVAKKKDFVKDKQVKQI